MKPKEFLSQAPFIRFVLPLMTGISVSLLWTVPYHLAFYLLIITLLLSFCFIIFKRLSINYRLRWVSGTSINLAIFCLGVIVTEQKMERPPNLLGEQNQPFEMIGIISGPPEAKTKSVQCFLGLEQVKTNTTYSNCNNKILLYLQKDSASLGIVIK